MKKISKLLLIPAVVLTLAGCSKDEPPIVSEGESTIIRNAKSVDEYVEKKDYKSLSYAYISKIKDELPSYESETNGNIKAKIGFIDYTINYHSVTFKRGSAFYSRDHSSSTFTNMDNEFYMANKDKILVSRDMKNYHVYTLDEYKKVSYTMAQYNIMGYIFTDETILKTDVISDQGDVVAIRYTLDNDLATKSVKIDFKINGELSAYPVFKSVRITLSMKRDFTPISYAIDAVYDASKPVLGSSTVTQHGECLFSKVGDDVIIPNEESLIQKLGEKPSEIVIDDENKRMKERLLKSLENIDLKNGVNVKGNLVLNLFESPLTFDVESDLLVDLSKITSDPIFSIFNYQTLVKGDEEVSSFVSLVKSLVKDDFLGLSVLLDNLQELDITYDMDGNLFLYSKNSEGHYIASVKLKVTDLIDVLIRNLNVYSIATQVNNESFNFSLVSETNENNYVVKMSLNDSALNSFRKEINKILEEDDYSMLKTLLSYKDLKSIDFVIGVSNGKISSLDASIKYLKEVDEAEVETEIMSSHFDLVRQTYDHQSAINTSIDVYAKYQSIQDLKSRLIDATENPYVSNGFLSTIDSLKEEFLALSSMEQDFVGNGYVEQLDLLKEDISSILLFLETYYKYDVHHLDNEDILELLKAYHLNYLNEYLLKDEIGDDFEIVSSLSQQVNYDLFNSALEKINGSDETSWGLTDDEIIDCKTILDIYEYFNFFEKYVFDNKLSTKDLTFNDFKEKILNLYNAL